MGAPCSFSLFKQTFRNVLHLLQCMILLEGGVLNLQIVDENCFSVLTVKKKKIKCALVLTTPVFLDGLRWQVHLVQRPVPKSRAASTHCVQRRSTHPAAGNCETIILHIQHDLVSDTKALKR